MYSELVLSGIIVALLVERYMTQKQHTQEIKRLIKAVLSKNVDEFTQSEVIEHINEREPDPILPEDFVPASQLDDDEFRKFIEQENG